MMYDIEERDGKLVTFPDYAPSDIKVHLQLCGGRTPMSLVVALSDRQRLQKLMRHKRCLISPEATELIDFALASSKKIARPLREPTSYEKVAYVDEKKELKCIKDVDVPERPDHPGGPKVRSFTAGKVYPFRSRAIDYVEPYTKTKMHFCEESKVVSSRVHQMSLEGKDFALTTTDDRGYRINFRDHPTIDMDVDEAKIWEYFEQPNIPTLAEDNRDQYDMAMEILRHMEVAGKFTFYPGQMKYIAQAACAESALISAETGCGKTLIAICLVILKIASRVLIVAPKGTVKDSKGKANEATKPSQWMAEFKKFAPEVPVYTLFSKQDYEKLKRVHGGTLPHGVFLTYDHVMFKDGMEQLPSTWFQRKKDPEALYRKRLGHEKFKVPALYNDFKERDKVNYHFGIGHTKSYEMHDDRGNPTGDRHAIKCIHKPCLSTTIGHYFWDMVILDEAHLICNLDAQITQNFIRMQPKYKFALSATPIPNMVWNIFSLMGWLCVPDWYQGHKLNPRWPYKLNDMGDFKKEFVSRDRDHTLMQQTLDTGRGPSYLKQSPIISQPAKLLKLLRPTVAFISKTQCNPNMPKSNVYDIRVPMTYQQRLNYTHFMDPANIPVNDARFRYGVQLAYLRGISANPVDTNYNLFSKTNFTPKTLMILETMYNCISRGEQVIHVSARHGMTNEIAKCLTEAKIKFSRIDGDSPDKTREAARFKDGDTQVLLMGIKCAQAFSFEQCKNLIIGSLEWSYGVFNQALGRIYRLTSPEDVNVYVMLHKNSMEELMFDKLGSKEDAATICLHGKRVPREIKTMSEDELLAQHVTGYDASVTGVEDHEDEVLSHWAGLREKFLTITHNKDLGITKDDQDAVAALIQEMEDYS
jgi:superfamily II DNA or RNA helicase